MNKRALFSLLAASGLLGCGAPATHVFDGAPGGGGDLAAAPPADLATPAGPVDLAMLLDMALPADLAIKPAGYPPGPYGTKVGDVIANLQWIGYADETGDAVATTKPYAAYAMQNLHASGRPYGFIHIAEVF